MARGMAFIREESRTRSFSRTGRSRTEPVCRTTRRHVELRYTCLGAPYTMGNYC